MNTIDITPIVNAAIALIGAGVSVFLIPWLKSQTTEAQRKELTAWVKIGVAAAEQLYKGAGRGEEKKQYVIDFLKQKGFKVDEESVITLSGLPRTPEARWTGAKLACPALQPEAFRLPARLCRLVTLTAGTWQEGRTELGWKRLIAAHGWETARLQADMQRTDAVRQIESRGDCVTLRQLAVTGADLPQLRGRDVGRMLQLLLAYVLEHPAENQKTRLLTLAPQLWQRESKNNS